MGRWQKPASRWRGARRTHRHEQAQGTGHSYLKRLVAVGKTKVGVAGLDRQGKPRLYTVCGILTHSSLAVITDGPPFGLTAIKFWARENFKGTNALKKIISPTRVPIEEKESSRWLDNLQPSTTLLERPSFCVHIGDRGSGIGELFCTPMDAGTYCVPPTSFDRLARDGSHGVRFSIRHGWANDSSQGKEAS